MTPTNADMDELARALLTLKSEAEVRAFLDDLCTPSEIRAFAERFKVASLLDEGQLSYRDIATRTGASTTTITRVARFLREMPHKGYRLVLDRMKAPLVPIDPTTASRPPSPDGRGGSEQD